jgi:hypothetical protein
MSRFPITVTLTIEPDALAALIAARDARAGTAAAREAFLHTFELEVDPDGLLPDEERRRRAAAARRERMRELGRASGQARRQRPAATTSAGGDHAGV